MGRERDGAACLVLRLLRRLHWRWRWPSNRLWPHCSRWRHYRSAHTGRSRLCLLLPSVICLCARHGLFSARRSLLRTLEVCAFALLATLAIRNSRLNRIQRTNSGRLGKCAEYQPCTAPRTVLDCGRAIRWCRLLRRSHIIQPYPAHPRWRHGRLRDGLIPALLRAKRLRSKPKNQGNWGDKRTERQHGPTSEQMR